MKDKEKKPFPQSVKIKCDKCKQDFMWDRVINAKLKGEVWEEYWVCPHCGDKSLLGYSNGMVRAYVGIIADAKRDIENSTGERKESLEAFLKCTVKHYKKTRDELKKDIERIKELNSEIEDYLDEEEYIKIDL